MSDHRGYHAHVYFGDAEQRAHALALQKRIPARWPNAALGRVHDRRIAFHPRPMYQVTFSPRDFGTFVPWLMQHHGPLSVLVHPVTGNVWQEHVEQSLWLGDKLALDLDLLRHFTEPPTVQPSTSSTPSAPSTHGAPNVSIRK